MQIDSVMDVRHDLSDQIVIQQLPTTSNSKQEMEKVKSMAMQEKKTGQKTELHVINMHT